MIQLSDIDSGLTDPAASLGFSVVDGDLTEKTRVLYEACEEVWGADGLLNPADARHRFETRGLLPDAILALSASDTVEAFLSKARNLGIDVPIFAPTPQLLGAEPPRRAVLLDASAPTSHLVGRIRDSLRESVRLEEARLRRHALGFLPSSTPAKTASLLVMGDSSHVARVLGQPGISTGIIGALSAEQALAQLQRTPVSAVVLNTGGAQTLEMVEHLRRDPRYVSLPVLAVADRTTADTLWAAGATDVVSPRDQGDSFANRLRPLLRASARVRLATAILKREREAHLSRGRIVPAWQYDAYFNALRVRLSYRGETPIERTLADLNSQPMARTVANDLDLTNAVGDPVRSAMLTASRDEDFVATVEGRGDVALLRSPEAAERLSRRIEAIVGQTAFT